MIRYHVIPHSHWDREWYLTFDEFRGMLVNMIDDLIEILERDPEYESFLLDGQTSVLEDYFEVRPERREKIMQMITSKRLFVGPWYVLPDSFLVSGEALIRNLLRGTRTAAQAGAERFVGYIPDSFGHTGQIPQIFRGFGIDTAIFWRGFGGEPGQEGSEYRWESPDGSWVLAEHLNEQGYSGAYFDSDDPEQVLATFNGIRERLDARTQAGARLMLSGGDHHWPVKRLPRVIQLVSEHLEEGATVIHSNLIEFFDDLKTSIDIETLPTIVGEQRFGYRWAFNVTGGVYSSRMYLKQANARCQRLLEGYLERLDAIVASRRLTAQGPLLRHAWATLLQNHPHDSICGCSIDRVHREMETRFGKVENTGRVIERFLWQELTDDVEGSHEDDRQIVVFNPSPFRRSDIVECEVEFHVQDVVVGLNPDVVPSPEVPRTEWIEITDQNGERVPFEVLERTDGHRTCYTRFGYPAASLVDRFRIRFHAEAVPALGFANYSVSKSDAKSESRPGAVRRVDDAIENDLIRLEVDSSGGFWVEDKASGLRFGPLGVLEDSGDAGDEYNYSPPETDQNFRSNGDQGFSCDITIERIDGGLRSGIAVSSTFKIPASLNEDRAGRTTGQVEIPYRTTAWVAAGASYVAFETELDNRAKDHRLRVLFETGCDTATHFAENAFSVVERRQRSYDEASYSIEVPTKVAPAQRFVLVEDGGHGGSGGRGGAVLTDGLPEYELMLDSNGTIALTLLRCVGQLSQDELKMRPGGRAGWHNPTPDAQCEGRHIFKYGFLPYTTPWFEHYDSIERAATSFLEPLRPRVTKRIKPPQPGSGLMSLHADGVALSTIKTADDGNGIIIRTYNPTPRSVSGFMKFGTVPENVQRVRLDERPIEGLVMTDSNTLVDSWKPYEIKTYRVDF